jgi:hypothetical protein
MGALYNCVTTPQSGVFAITKFDPDLNPLISYLTTQATCNCPRELHSTCRHRRMLSLFHQQKHINDGWFLNFDTRQWTEPPADFVESGEGFPDWDASKISANPQCPRPFEYGANSPNAPVAEDAADPLPPAAPAEITPQPSENATGAPLVKRRRIGNG